MFGMSVLQIGEVIATVIVAAAGALLFVNGLRRLNAPSASPLPTAMATGMQHSYGTATEPRTADDGFFGGAIVPAQTATATGYQANPLPPISTKPSGSPLPVILLILGLVLMSGAAYEGYNLWAHRSPIHMPDQLLGMHRVADDSPLAAALDSADDQLEGR